MMDAKGPFRIGALFVGLSGIVHILALFVSGFDADALILIPAGVLYIGFAYGLLRGHRWLAYLVFLVMMVGSLIALSAAWSTPGVPTWIYLSIVALDWLAVLALFGALWRKPATAA
jgi:hypothetical protein